MATLLTKNNYLFSQLLIIVLLTVFSAMLLLIPLTTKHGLYNDQLRSYSSFRDNLHALNYFGEFAWWNPHIRTGFPMYYVSILGGNTSSPLFVLLGVIVWLLGLMNIKLASYYPLWIGYFGILLPLAFNIGMWSLSRQIFKRASIVFFTIILSSFSPGIVFNISDSGFDTCVYGIVFLSMYLKFQNHPRKLTFLGFAATLLMLTVSISYLFLHWMLIFIPLFMASCLIWNAEGLVAMVKKMKECVPAVYWFILMLSVCMCVIPQWLTFLDGSDILRSRSGSRVYSYWNLAAGSPLEVVGISIPGVDFVRRSDAGIWLKQQIIGLSSLLKAQADTQSYYIYLTYTYLGILALPLCIFGLLFGDSFWRKRLFCIVTVAFGIVVLSAHSPIFSMILAIPSPLRAVDHYSDNAFNLGMFIPLILLAGVGFDTLISSPQLRRTFVRYFVIIAWILSAIYIGVYVIRLGIAGIVLKGFDEKFDLQTLDALIFQSSALGEFFYYLTTLFSFWITLIVLIWIALKWLASSETAASEKTAIMTLLLLTLLDVSTVMFLHSRYIIRPGSSVVNETSIETIGSEGEIAYYANHLLFLQQEKTLENSGVNVFALPEFALADRIGAMQEGIGNITWDGRMSLSMIPLPESYRALPEFRQFLKPQISADAFVKGTIVILRQTYNSLTINVTTPVKALVFWRDAYFQPYWQAQVNHEAAAIAPAFGAYKTVAVPEGESVVTFRFAHRSLSLSVLSAYTIFLISLFINGIARYREHKHKQPKQA